MKHNHPHMPAAGTILDFGVVSAWLLALLAVNRQSGQPVTLLVPYVAPVVYIAWRYGVLAGIVVATFATFVAAPQDYVRNHDTGPVLWAVFSTYCQMTSVALGAVIARRAGQSKMHK